MTEDITFTIKEDKLAPLLKISGIDYSGKTDVEIVQEYIINMFKDMDLHSRKLSAEKTAGGGVSIDNNLIKEK